MAATKAGVQLVKTFKLAVAKGPDLLDLCAAPTKVAAKPAAKKPEPAKPVVTKPVNTKPAAIRPANSKPTAKAAPTKPVKTESKALSEYPGLQGEIEGDTIA